MMHLVVLEYNVQRPFFKGRNVKAFHRIDFYLCRRNYFLEQSMDYTCIRVYRPDGYQGVGAIQIARPEVRNALSLRTMEELVDACTAYEQDSSIGCIVLHGDDRAFAAGADIREMNDATTVVMLERDQFARWERLRQIKKPMIAAVSGFALGGGCELAMLCDIIIASDTAQFGQPEINIGVMPGAGGTQRLTRAIGKSLAMELVLTGRMISAHRALERGLVSRVVPVEYYLHEAFALAEEIACKAPVAVRLAKESVGKAFSTPLELGLEYERKNFYMLFSTDDQKEGMAAFLEKRTPQWKGR
jgi:enoyl-CoA hydratase